MCYSSQCSARGRACSAVQRAMHYASSPRRSRAAGRSCAVSLSAVPPLPLASVTETTKGGSSRRPRGGALVLVVERCLRRPTPSPRAFFGLC